MQFIYRFLEVRTGWFWKKFNMVSQYKGHVVCQPSEVYRLIAKTRSNSKVVCYSAALRDDTNNGCAADWPWFKGTVLK